MSIPLWVLIVCAMCIAQQSQAILDLLIKKKLEAAKSHLFKSPSYVTDSNFNDYYILKGIDETSSYRPYTHGYGTSHFSVPGSTGAINIGGAGNLGGAVTVTSNPNSGGGFHQQNVNFGITQTNQGNSGGTFDSSLNYGSHTGVTGTSTFQVTQGGNVGIFNQGTGVSDITVTTDSVGTIPNINIEDTGGTTVTEIVGPAVEISVSDDQTSSVGTILISSEEGDSGSYVDDGSVINVSLSTGTVVCPVITLPVIKDITMTQFSTEYVTVPQQIASYVFTTVPFQKTMLVTQTVKTTITKETETEICTSTKVIYDTSTLKKGQVVQVTKSVTHTDLIQRTLTVTNTYIHTVTVTKIQTNRKSVYRTVAGATRTITHLTSTTTYVTNTKTSKYDVTTQTVAGSPYPIWITTTELKWVPYTVTKTISNPNYKTVWKKCGGY